MDLGYRVFDADNHYYEPRDAFTRYIDPPFADRAVRPVIEPDGSEEVYVGDQQFTFLEHRNFDTAPKPGMLREMLQAMKQGHGGGQVVKRSQVSEPHRPEYVTRAARVEVLDAQGVEAAVLFPTLAVCVEHFMVDDPDLLYANLGAFNRWLDDEWGLNRDGRIHAPPLLSLVDPDRAVAELEWALDRGARIVSLRPGPAAGRNIADPVFDQFWARINEARAVVGFHIGESGYNQSMSVHWGEEPNPPSHRQSALQWTCFYGDRPIMETIAALIYANLFTAFPNVRVMSVENGSLWVDYLMAAMNKMNRMGRNGPWLRGPLTERPSDIFRRHVFVSPYHEEPIAELAATIGTSQVLFGSDWPHAEGLAEPLDFTESLVGMSDAEVRMIMRDNLAGLVAP